MADGQDVNLRPDPVDYAVPSKDDFAHMRQTEFGNHPPSFRELLEPVDEVEDIDEPAGRGGPVV